MVEYEKKILLTEKEYRSMLSMIPSDCQVVTQINRYFDTADWQKHTHGITCRIREKNGTYTATEKCHRVGSLERSLEFSYSVSDPYDISPFQTEGLEYQGFLTTERTVWRPEEGIRVCLDRNTYLETEDYELEIEYEDEEAANEWLLQIALAMVADGTLHSPWDLLHRVGQTASKSTRFFERKKQYNLREST